MHYPVIHIVKRFGRVGGMESYVWHLVHGLSGRGFPIFVVCEQICEAPEASIRVIQVETSPEKPRYKSMLSFRARVDQKIREELRGFRVLIHSHERSLRHLVTTFHGPPIEPPRGYEWFLRFNKRLKAWQKLERDELLAPNVQMVLPVSSLVQEQLANQYPEVLEKKLDLAWPGVDLIDRVPSLRSHRNVEDARLLFVGKEWKRKGLDIAVRIVENIRQTLPAVTLTAFGVNQSEIPGSMRALEWITFRGWSPEIPWREFDMLLHPAFKEPFGMVVAEARSYGLPVLMSSLVGAADLEFSETKILDVDAPLTEWAKVAVELIETNTGEPEIKWSWDDLVTKHIDVIYPQLNTVTL